MQGTGCRKGICGSLGVALALALAGPAGAAPRDLLLDLNARPLSVTNPDEGTARVRMLSNSGRFSLLVSESHGYFGTSYWTRRRATGSSRSVFDLELQHQPEGSWIRAHVGSRSRHGMPGVLAVASVYARNFIIEYDPDEVVHEISLETYRGSVMYCGRIPHTHFRASCSLAHVVLHGRETIRFYGLIVARSARQRDALLREFASVLGTLELHKARGESIPDFRALR